MFKLVLAFAKTYDYLTDKFGKHKSVMIGVLVYNLYPDFLSRMAKQKK